MYEKIDEKFEICKFWKFEDVIKRLFFAVKN